MIVQFVLDTSGVPNIETMKLIRTTDPELNYAAFIVVRGCHYSPARIDGRPTSVIIQQPVLF